mmetsp:Transcript_27180/g.5017  ORF Transcript_27180/g.5017 Transcript_27180/m.5017 type:complete len:91 (+) Transcript_27180:390-662(+)
MKRELRYGDLLTIKQKHSKLIGIWGKFNLIWENRRKRLNLLREGNKQNIRGNLPKMRIRRNRLERDKGLSIKSSLKCRRRLRLREIGLGK